MSREILEVTRMRDLVHGGLVRSIRLGAGLSLSEVARECGVTNSAVVHWEKGRSLPRGEVAVRYSQLLLALERVAQR